MKAVFRVKRNRFDVKHLARLRIILSNVGAMNIPAAPATAQG